MMLAASAYPGYVVCDPFVGSGSSAIAALNFGCSFVGCDISMKAVEIANRLDLALLAQHEVRGAKPGDRAIVTIHHLGVHADERNVALEDEFVVPGRDRQQKSTREDQCKQASSTAHKHTYTLIVMLRVSCPVRFNAPRIPRYNKLSVTYGPGC